MQCASALTSAHTALTPPHAILT